MVIQTYSTVYCQVINIKNKNMAFILNFPSGSCSVSMSFYCSIHVNVTVHKKHTSNPYHLYNVMLLNLGRCSKFGAMTLNTPSLIIILWLNSLHPTIVGWSLIYLLQFSRQSKSKGLTFQISHIIDTF